MNDVAELLRKARQAVASARLLVNAGDADGAVNRAYYAMFDAARAALAHAGVPLDMVRTHSGVIGAFGQHYVKNGTVARHVGKAINDVEKMRLLADYSAATITKDDATSAVQWAELFVAAVEQVIGQPL